MTAFTPYGSISLDASPSGAVGNFTDSASISADNVRVYNAGSVEVFVGFGKSNGDKAEAHVPTKDETRSSFSIPPRESEVLYKGAGNDQVAVVTSGGLSPVRFTAIKIQNSGGDLMSSLELVSVLKDAMSNQKIINAAVEKIANANNISEQKRKEAEAAVKLIADAKIAFADLEKEKAEHLKNKTKLRDDIIAFNAQADEIRKNIESERLIAKDDIDNQLAALTKAKTEVQSLHSMAAQRDNSASEKEKSTADMLSILAESQAAHEFDKQKLADDKKEHEKNVAEFIAYKRNLENALKGK